MTYKTQQIFKLLNLTKSDNDHEVLQAIRKVNQLIESDWDKFLASLDRASTTPKQPQVDAGLVDQIGFIRKHERLLKEAEQDLFYGIVDFIEIHGQVSAKQRGVIESLHRKVIRKGARK